ncbi:MAG: aldo/keto reductase [Pseudomonadales bacterium]|nr:aldo/keto reductase [Pseudomonadales bacterium]
MRTARLSLGTVKLGRDKGVKYPTSFTIPDDKAAKALLATAKELGINMLDTAPAYGNSEERLGELIKRQRTDWLICTKVGETFDGNQSSHDFSPEAVQASVERSLVRLVTDYLDIVLIHSDGQDRKILTELGTLEALKQMKVAGKIRAVGISHKSVEGAELALSQGVDVIMATLNPDYLDDRAVIASAAQQGCGVLIKKALSSGHGSARDLAFVAAQTGVHSIVVGTTNPEHLIENARQVASV